MLVYAIVFINAALVFYSIGVWAEKIQGTLKKWHVGLFMLGLICDTTGTLLMENIAKNSTNQSGIHGVTGVIAILLMLLHALWAIYVLIKKDEIAIKKFHNFSIVVWAIWLVPFLTGALLHLK